MLVFDSLETGPLGTNCYIIGDFESKEAAVVDPGGHVGAILSCLDRHKLSCKWIINTHAHFDHVGGNKDLKEATDALIMIHEAEEKALTQLSSQGKLFGLLVENSPPADQKINEGDSIGIGSVRIKVHHTPGHSPGSISLAIEENNKILVGDLVFAGSIGRTDLPGGSFEELLTSVKEKIFVYPEDTSLYPGHGPPTSIGQERRYNPFLTGGSL